LDSVIEKLDFKLVFICFPDEFTSLQKISQDRLSSRFQNSIHLREEMMQIVDMFQDKKAEREIKGLIREGECGLQITDSLFYIFTIGMFSKKFLCNITSGETFEGIFVQ